MRSDNDIVRDCQLLLDSLGHGGECLRAKPSINTPGHLVVIGYRIDDDSLLAEGACWINGRLIQVDRPLGVEQVSS